MRIALATCRDLPDWEVDDRSLEAALAARGVEVLKPAWDDEAFDWSGCDACVIRTTWDYTPRIEAFLAWVSRVAASTRLFNPPEVIRWNADKRYLRDLEQRGVAVVPTIWVERGEGGRLAEELRARDWPRGFLKPVVGANSLKTLRFRNDEAGRAEAVAHFDAADCAMLAQPYLESVETRGEMSALLFGGAVSHAVRKVPVPGDYRVQDDYGAHDEPWNLRPEEERSVASVAACLPPGLLYARIDFLWSGTAWLCNEVELIEPSLFLRHDEKAGARFANALLAALGECRST